ncbi:MAG: 3-dehydroquinate synthase [Deltaproteobacteria bacterium CG2_30_63_29]|nr:MAG: 3-dehydroquinate synthase [Deltaproteobacteria bacterium CG2_30_63_29]
MSSHPKHPIKASTEPIEELRRFFESGTHGHKVAVVGDSNTAPLYGRPIADALDELDLAAVLRLEFPAGESHKNRETKQQLEDQLLRGRLGREDVLIAVGGGVVSDLTGFVAATYLRGIDWVAVPTTVLAQVDAAIGGKTGVNTPHGKNLIGAFHPPLAVFQHLPSLATLSPLELRNGLAECVKHAVIADVGLFEELEALGRSGTLLPNQALMARCAAVKVAVVDEDPREQGRRRTLNFGHTVGHGVEYASALSHGHAVAIGMLVEGTIAVEMGFWAAQDLDRLRGLLQAFGLPTAPTCRLEDAMPYLLVDKKNSQQDIHCVMPSRIGATHPFDGRWTCAVSFDSLREAWKARAPKPKQKPLSKRKPRAKTP